MTASRPGATSAHRTRRRSLVSLAWLGVLALTGCQVARETARLPVQMVSAVVPRGRPAPPDPANLQVQVQRFADDFAGRTAGALDEYLRLNPSPEARQEVLGWRVSLGASVMGIATGPNPVANLLDLLALSTLTRATLEQLAPNRPAGTMTAWLEASRALETNAWNLASGMLTREEQEELRAALQRWLAEHGEATASFFARPQEFATLIRQTVETPGRPESVFSLVRLDPTAGLDPAVREVTRTRLLAERALYAAQRLPFILRWQIELLGERLLPPERITNALHIADRLALAAESASRTAAALPDRLSGERQAILEALDQQDGRLRELSSEVGRTLRAGEQMSASLNQTLTTFDALMKRFGVGEPEDPAPAAGGTPSPPFNILDYARTAEQITVMARQLDALLNDTTGTLDSPAVDRRIADLNALSARARADAQAVLNHAFLLATGLLGLAFIVALTYRRLGRPAARAS